MVLFHIAAIGWISPQIGYKIQGRYTKLNYIKQYISTVEIATLHVQIKKRKTNYTRTNITNHRNDSKYIHASKIAVKIGNSS